MNKYSFTNINSKNRNVDFNMRQTIWNSAFVVLRGEKANKHPL